MSQEMSSESDQSPCELNKSGTTPIPTPDSSLSSDDLKDGIISALESELTNRLRVIDERLREAKVLVEGMSLDPIKRFVSVKLDFLRSLRPPGDRVKHILDEDETGEKALEDLFDGIPGWVVVTDAQLKTENVEAENLTLSMAINIEHTIVLKDGKFFCEWTDPKNPLVDEPPIKTFGGKPYRREELISPDGMPTIRYHI